MAVDPLPMQNQHEELQVANSEHQVTVESTDNNAVIDIQSLVTINANDLDTKDSPISYMASTVSSSAKFRTKVKIPARPGFNHFTKGFPSILPIHFKHRSLIGGTGAKEHMTGTVSNTAKDREKAPLIARPGFNHFTKQGFSSIMPIPSKHRGSIGGTGAKGYMAEIVSNDSKHRKKAPINNCSGYNNFTKDGPGFPPILPITNDKPNKPSRIPVPSNYHSNKRRVIGDSRAKQGCLFDTISCSAKFRS